jgi:exopolysaccharide biosynthesis protein
MLLKINIPKPSRTRIPKATNFFKRCFGREGIIFIVYLVAFVVLGVFTYHTYQQNITTTSKLNFAVKENEGLNSKLTDAQKSYEELKNEDQYLKNRTLEEEIKNIQNTYKKAVTVYESLLDLKDKTKDTGKFDDTLASAFTLLSQRNYSDAADKLNILSSDIKKKSDEIAASFKIPENAIASNSPPGSGYQRQKVTAEGVSFLVDLISADIGSTKVIVDTASDSDCTNDCPVLPLGDYIKRNNAYAGINGSYFCPSTYPSCAGKTNSFDLLAMNYKKTYFNSGNNVYSSNPAVIFGDGYVRFVSSASEWGRDTSPNGVLSNYPLLLLNGDIRFSGDGDEKKTSKGGRSFVANKGNNIYIGVVFSATVSESAKVMKALGFENAINLDDGGSTALWYGGYKAGPGRNIPNAILFVKK